MIYEELSDKITHEECEISSAIKELERHFINLLGLVCKLDGEERYITPGGNNKETILEDMFAHINSIKEEFNI